MDKRPLKVFLCHAHADRDPVRGLYTRLTQDGVDAWLDKAKLLPGQDWELEIRKAVREADVVVVCLSKQFNQAGFRQKEVRLALDTAMEKPEGEIFIIPARLEECDNLESLRRWHWVDLFEEDGYEMLMRALRARADRIGVTLQIKKNWLPNIVPSRLAQPNSSVVSQPVAKQASPSLKPEVKKPKAKLNLKQMMARLSLLILVVTSVLALVSSFLRPPIQAYTPIPTITISSTTNPQIIGSPSPTVSLSNCKATVLDMAFVFDVPSYGGISRAFLGMGTQVDVIAKLDDGGWYPISWNGEYGWVLSETLQLDKECPVSDTLVHLLSLVNTKSFVNDKQNIVVEDTFATNKYLWLDNNGSPSLIVSDNSTGESRLVFSENSGYRKITSSVITEIADPAIAVSMERRNDFDNGYIGFFFENTVYDNFEIRILNDCAIQVFENMNLLVKVDNTGGAGSCSDQTSDYFELRVIRDQLDLRINGQNVNTINLSKDYGKGSLSFVTENADISFNFIVISTPR